MLRAHPGEVLWMKASCLGKAYNNPFSAPRVRESVHSRGAVAPWPRKQ